jgi:hypothetical protein
LAQNCPLLYIIEAELSCDSEGRRNVLRYVRDKERNILIKESAFDSSD